MRPFATRRWHSRGSLSPDRRLKDAGTAAWRSQKALPRTSRTTSREWTSRVFATFGRDLRGVVATTGRLTGPSSALHFAGEMSLMELYAFDLSALAASGKYDATLPASEPSRGA